MRAALLLPALLLAAVCLAADGPDRALGKTLFERVWAPAPTATDTPGGLGPLFAERSCIACHSGPGGGASIAVNADGVVARGLSIRLGDTDGRPDPVYGTAFQTRAVTGLAAEGAIRITAPGLDAPLAVKLAPSRGPLAPKTRISIRLAPPLAARSRLETIDAGAILARADPDDADGDGVSGHPNMISTPAGPMPGRFGWKATQVDLDHQIAHAFAFDLGLSSPLYPLPYGDCTPAEPDCLAAPNGRSPAFDGEEISLEMIRNIAGYIRGLEPAPAAPDPAGEALFAAIGCAACHVPALPAKDGAPVTVYSDLQLHDMGPALDDGVGAPGVRSSEWRTAPLVGLAWSRGSTRRYLHDGRAPTIDAAIRAHGGEALAAASKYEALSPGDRLRLLLFLANL